MACLMSNVMVIGPSRGCIIYYSHNFSPQDGDVFLAVNTVLECAACWICLLCFYDTRVYIKLCLKCMTDIWWDCVFYKSSLIDPIYWCPDAFVIIYLWFGSCVTLNNRRQLILCVPFHLNPLQIVPLQMKSAIPVFTTLFTIPDNGLCYPNVGHRYCLSVQQKPIHHCRIAGTQCKTQFYLSSTVFNTSVCVFRLQFFFKPQTVDIHFVSSHRT